MRHITRGIRRLGLLTAMLAAVVFATATQASASQNAGWVYTLNRSGAVFFDADLNGYAGYEKITVCDNLTDGRGIVAYVGAVTPGGDYKTYTFKDPSHDGQCRSWATNYFVEEHVVFIDVCNYWGDNLADCAHARAVS
ncbi:hypothetical protein [Streptomyces sp. RFCAC02]|uniref:hypothetical protein n=1 Tax=Streptomyces sp. RFCAC02 TaxID=2499143 RepID=UPI001020AB63|nr:hypothetical protein [Streptomyces sp. RFCAC02]